MSEFDTKICSEKQYNLVKKLWDDQKSGIQNFKELLIVKDQFIAREKLRASEASMIIKVVLG